jgi:hypothetical protein
LAKEDHLLGKKVTVSQKDVLSSKKRTLFSKKRIISRRKKVMVKRTMTSFSQKRILVLAEMAFSADLGPPPGVRFVQNGKSFFGCNALHP